jgi:hypothetical protein
MKLVWIVALALTTAALMPAHAQQKPAGAAQSADSMQILREKLQADKKQLVSANMTLTDAEAKSFWPIYDEHQRMLQEMNDRLATLLVSYSKEYNTASLTDEKAVALLERYFAMEEEELKLRRAFVPRLAKVLPGRKVARYIQIENKIRALVKYEIAGEVPLVK